MNFDLNKIIEKFKYDPNSVKKNYDGKTDIYLAKVSYRYAYFKRIICLICRFMWWRVWGRVNHCDVFGTVVYGKIKKKDTLIRSLL